MHDRNGNGGQKSSRWPWSARKAAGGQTKRKRRLAFETLEPRHLLNGGPIISEFMASNGAALADEDGDYSDWIELHNPTSDPIVLDGWYLTDNANKLTKWRLPDPTPSSDLVLGPGQYLVIFASEKNRTDLSGTLHTSFSLGAGGEYLALVEPDGQTIAHHYAPEFPTQFRDISYGIAQNVEKTEFVSVGATARYLVSSSYPANWTGTAFNDSGWLAGPSGIGYASVVPGFNVHNYKANQSIGSLAVALQVLADPAMQSYVRAENAAVINYWNSDAHGHYATNENSFPGFGATVMDWFVIEAKAYVTIPTAGLYTFGVNSDDGCQLTILGATTTLVYNSSNPAGSDTISFAGLRGASDTLGVYSFPAAGTYEVRLVSFENGGGSSAEFFAAQGSRSTWDATNFRLVGDVAGGGLAVASLPVSSGSTGGVFGLVETNVESAMKGVNASLLARFNFNLTDPALYESLTLRMKYDDGFVAYLNGHEIARRNAPGTLTATSAATVDRNITQAVQWESIDLTAHLDKLLVGANVLAFQGLNFTAGDGDFLLLPELAQIKTLGLGEFFFDTATPGEPNTSDTFLAVADTEFSLARGFYERLSAGQSYELVITTPTAGATIYYTLDGTAPSPTNGYTYQEPIHFNETTIVRALAHKPGLAASTVISHTYIFLDDVLQQPASLGGDWPDVWSGVYGGTATANYAVDPRIVESPLYAATIKSDLLAIPTMSLVIDPDYLWDYNTGIYVNPGQRGVAWERPVSVEYIGVDGESLFQVNAGIRVQGGASRGTQNKKHSLRLLFKSDYGPTTLDFPFFGDEAVDKFNSLSLRANFNDVWPNNGVASYLNDPWTLQTQLDLGGVASHGSFVHLYINGVYWGLYNSVERPDDAFAASYFGGEKEDYDTRSQRGLNEGTADSWNLLQSLLNDPVANYAAIQQMLDIPAFIDYMIINQFGANWDWPHNNWRATYNREAGGKWYFHSWDGEGNLRDVSGNRIDSTGGPGDIFLKLRNVAEFRVTFGDHVHRHLFNNGGLTPAANIARINELAAQIDRAIVGESARWGDGYSDSGALRTRDVDWVNRVNWLRSTFFPQRTNIAAQQYRDAGLYPSVVAPLFHIDGAYQHGGPVAPNGSLSITATAGTIYYTLDGSDPRLTGGGISPTALVYSGPVALGNTALVKSRAYSGGSWSALNEATYYVDLAPHLRISEIMYNPAAQTVEEIAAGFDDQEAFEFIELVNTSTTLTLPLDGLRFSNGIEFTFPDVLLGPGQYIVVAKNLAAFNFRYSTFSGVVLGGYEGQLSNSGERIVLDMPVGGIVHDFSYNDTWYAHTDGVGFSLTIRDPLGAKALWDTKAGWRASEPTGGTPGTSDAALGYQAVNPGSILISEVLAHNDMLLGDVIELYNASSQAINVGGWFISDQRSYLTRDQLPTTPEMLIQPGQYLALYEGVHFTNFSLDRFGDDITLSSNAGGAPGGYREVIAFGESPLGISVGRHVRSDGKVDFVPLSETTFGGPNAAPYLEALVIGEMMYNPPSLTPLEIAAGWTDRQDFEFIELYNRSAFPVNLRNYYLGDGIGTTFGWYDTDTVSGQVWTMEPGATAAWNSALPDGLAQYEVFVRWDLIDLQGGVRQLDDAARYTVVHAGGSNEVILDQEDDDPAYRNAEGWVSLGTYSFDGNGQIVLTRGTDSASRWTIAEGLKFVRTSDQLEVIADEPVLDSWYTSHGPAVIAPGERVVIVRNVEAFDLRYDIAGNGIAVAGAYSGRLSNDGELVSVYRVASPEADGHLWYFPIDRVDYRNATPWPTEADGRGPSMNRLNVNLYGNDPAHWDAGAFWGTPGAANVAIDRTAPTTPGGLSSRVTLGPPTIALNWNAASDSDSHVSYYVVYRDGTVVGISNGTSFEDADVAGLLSNVTYQYRVSAVNRDGFEGALSTPLVVKIPGIAHYGITNSRTIQITFTEALTAASAAQLSNYLMTGESLIGASLSGNGRTVTLTTSAPLTVGGFYTITVVGAKPLSGNDMRNEQRIRLVYEPYAAGSILRQWWTDITGSAITALTSNANYPNNPSGSALVTTYLEGPTSFADNYGTRFQGFIHAPVSGEYIFWIASDDNGQLWLSTDANPANRKLIASVPDWTGSRQWDKHPSQQSVAITLVAGQKYYIEVLQKEGAGGDNVAVRWQLPGGVWENPSQPALPIPATRLSPWTADTTVPQAAIFPVYPSSRNTPVDSITFTFSETIVGLDLADLRLTRNGGTNLLTGAETLTTTDNITWTLGNLTGLTRRSGSYSVTLVASGSGIQDTSGNLLNVSRTASWTALPTEVVGRHLFYNDSAFDGNGTAVSTADDAAIATDKAALLPGQTATFANYSSYSKGLNGIVIDVASLWSTSLLATTNPATSSFEFRLGNDDAPDQWRSSFDALNPVPLPEVHVLAGKGADGADRVLLVWPNGALPNSHWLQVRLAANETTGLAHDDVFYFGLAIGDTGLGNAGARVLVNVADAMGARHNSIALPALASITNAYDFDRDRDVDVADQLIARNHQAVFSHGLVLISPPALQPAALQPTAPSPMPAADQETLETAASTVAFEATATTTPTAEPLPALSARDEAIASLARKYGLKQQGSNLSGLLEGLDWAFEQSLGDSSGKRRRMGIEIVDAAFADLGQ